MNTPEDEQAIEKLRNTWPGWTPYKDQLSHCHAIHAATLVTVTSETWTDLNTQIAQAQQEIDHGASPEGATALAI